MVAFVVFMAGMTAQHTPPTRAYGQTSELLGMTAGEVRAAANGDVQLQEKLAARLCEIANAPWMTGQAELSLSSTSLAGSHTDSLELGWPTPWLKYWGTESFIDLAMRRRGWENGSTSMDGWTWMSIMTVGYSWHGRIGPMKVVTAQFVPLCTGLLIIVVIAVAMQPLRRRLRWRGVRPACTVLVLAGAAVVLFLPKIKSIDRPSGNTATTVAPTYSLAQLRLDAASAAGRQALAFRINVLANWPESSPVIVDWRMPPSATMETARIGWPLGWVSWTSHDVVPTALRGGESTGLSWYGAGFRWRLINASGALTDRTLSIGGIAVAAVPIIIIAGAPLVGWRMVSSRLTRRRARLGLCLACGYPLPREPG
jgi:hypothetical protein